jgi:hypothetical protein
MCLKPGRPSREGILKGWEQSEKALKNGISQHNKSRNATPTPNPKTMFSLQLIKVSTV